MTCVNAGSMGEGVKLSDLEPFSITDISCKDAYESRYVESNFKESFMEGAILYAESSYVGSAEYYLGGEYAVLSGTFYVPYESREQDEISTFRIYGDDKLLYDGPSLTGKDKPVAFEVNVEGVEFLEILAGGGWFKGDGSSLKPSMCAGNLILHRENSSGVAKNNNLPTKFLSEIDQFSHSDLYGYRGIGREELLCDMYGNTYRQVGIDGSNGIIANDSSEESYVEYYVNGMYKRLTGTAYVPMYSVNVDENNYCGSPCMKIYVDDVLVYQLSLTGKDKPVEFDINIENADFLKVELYGGWYKGDGTGMNPLMCAANLAVYE